MARIDGTPFDDFLDGDRSGFTEDDQIYGYEDNDFLLGLGGNDTLYGGDGLDTLLGYTGNDALYGEAGNDFLGGGSGNDWLDGGDGSDTASYVTAPAGVTVELTPESYGEQQHTIGAGVDTLLNIEHLTGSKFNDTLYIEGMESESSTVNGGAGNDYLEANYSFNFRLIGGAGNDHLISGHGIGTLNGGTGNDHLESYEGGVLNGGDGDDVLEAGYIFSIDTILNGGAGNDVLTFLQDGGRLNGGSGNDELNGGYGTDRLNGGSGKDRLNGGSFKDTLTGGNQSDLFMYESVEDSQAGSDNRDVITDFMGKGTAVGDQIDLRDIYPGTLIWGGPWTAGHARYVGGVVQVNTNSDAAAEFEIQLTGAPGLFVQTGHAGSDILL